MVCAWRKEEPPAFVAAGSEPGFADRYSTSFDIMPGLPLQREASYFGLRPSKIINYYVNNHICLSFPLLPNYIFIFFIFKYFVATILKDKSIGIVIYPADFKKYILVIIAHLLDSKNALSV